MDEIVINSYAKINLGLHIINKRDDGFHDLETIFYPLKLSDKITYSKSDNFEFITNNNLLSTESTNLIITAKELLEEVANKNINCKIYLEKNIPIGAGLGGGSSNAAVTIMTLNKMFMLNLSKEILAALALKLGSDVPFFLNPIPSFATSRGEILKTLPIKLNGYLLLVNPGIHISTRWAFDNIKPKKINIDLDKVITNIENGYDISELLTNDFEEIVFKKHPKIAAIKERLNKMGAYFSLMSGSGSTVFGIFKNKVDAEITKENFQNEYFTYLEEL